MFNRLVARFLLLFIFTKKEIFSTPIAVLKPFQSANGETILSYHEKNPLDVDQNRAKRFLDDIVEFFSLFDDYFYSDEEDDESSEDINNGTAVQCALCCNCSFSCHEISQIQPIHQTDLPLSAQQSLNTIQTAQVVGSTETARLNIYGLLETERALKENTSAKKEIKPLTKKPDSTTSIQQTLANGVSVTTESSSSTQTSSMSPTNDFATSTSPTKAITTEVVAGEE